MGKNKLKMYLREYYHPIREKLARDWVYYNPHEISASLKLNLGNAKSILEPYLWHVDRFFNIVFLKHEKLRHVKMQEFEN